MKQFRGMRVVSESEETLHFIPGGFSLSMVFLKSKVKLSVTVEKSLTLGLFPGANGVKFCMMSSESGECSRWDSKKKTMYLVAGSTFDTTISQKTCDFIIEAALSLFSPPRNNPFNETLDKKSDLLGELWEPCGGPNDLTGLTPGVGGLAEDMALEDERLQEMDKLIAAFEAKLFPMVSEVVSSFVKEYLAPFSQVRSLLSPNNYSSQELKNAQIVARLAEIASQHEPLNELLKFHW